MRARTLALRMCNHGQDAGNGAIYIHPLIKVVNYSQVNSHKLHVMAMNTGIAIYTKSASVLNLGLGGSVCNSNSHQNSSFDESQKKEPQNHIEQSRTPVGTPHQ